jgi:hypothetical protein
LLAMVNHVFVLRNYLLLLFFVLRLAISKVAATVFLPGSYLIHSC